MSQLAIKGGDKAVTLDQGEADQWPIIDDEVTEAVVNQLKSGEISFSETIYKFEEEFAAYHGVKYALAHNNGTASIHGALFGVGVGPGDEVITPAATFWGTYMPILSCQAIPVFCDIDPFTGCAAPEDIERRISPHTKAMIVVHLGGMPAEMDAVMALARRHNLIVIEDCSHAHGATYKGKKVGTIGDVGCFSMQAGKLLPSGEGGVMITNNLEYYERAVCLGHYERISRLPSEKYHKYASTCLGYKYRITPISAAIARVQLRHLDERNKRRNANVMYLMEGIAECPGIYPIKPPDYAFRGYYSRPYVRYAAEELGGLPKEKFIQALQAEGVHVSSSAPGGSNHLTAVFQERNHTAFTRPEVQREVKYQKGDLPASENPREDLFTIPAFPSASRELLDQYIEAFRKVVINIAELRSDE
ncbi:MAG: DegT/DnrJ/EryC1/StrS family aminotransferase [Candidatus Poribacteria bacterium]|nr:DegT/DnrJ/EryC1/StrS family aminotransferase [Candidatus Poribacteria bacterium]